MKAGKHVGMPTPVNCQKWKVGQCPNSTQQTLKATLLWDETKGRGTAKKETIFKSTEILKAIQAAISEQMHPLLLLS